MPPVKVKHVVSFSSEDAKNPAENILKPETYHKWKCATAGERQATLLLQLEMATRINGIDIGNNNSAFVEVLVGRSSWSSNEEFKVLLAASSFMTPAESKAVKEIHRVRMFGQEHIVKSIADEKWDQLKIVCTQPYNQNESYGLSFLKLHSPADPKEKDEEKVIQLGRFKLKSNSDDELNVPVGSFFQRRLGSSVSTPKQESKLSMASSARKISSSTEHDTVFKTKCETTVGQKRISLSHDKRHEVAASLLQGASNSITPKEKPSLSSSTVTAQKNNQTPKRKIGKDETTVRAECPPPKKVKANQPKSKAKKKNLPYNTILEGVVFVLSGYENPQRGNIRDLALSMGAKYESVWNNECTHLICAFANTPKYNQVKGRGKIVKKTWITSCHEKKRRLNTKSFRMDDGGESSYESSEKEEEEVKLEIAKQQVNSSKSQSFLVRKKSSSECDTEEELERICGLQKNDEKRASTNTEDNKRLASKKGEDPYGGTTEEESADEQDGGTLQDDGVEIKRAASSLPELPDFFDGKSFFFYGDFDVKDKRLLRRYIMAYSGAIEEYMNESVDYVISNAIWDKNFEQENICRIEKLLVKDIEEEDTKLLARNGT